MNFKFSGVWRERHGLTGFQSPNLRDPEPTDRDRTWNGQQLCHGRITSKKHPYDSVDDALKSQDFRCGHCGVLVMVLRLQSGPGGQARPGVCALQEVEMENGGGSQKWCTLIPGWPTAGRERRTAAAQPLPPRSRFARVNLDETPLPMVPDPRQRESEKTMDDGMRKTSNP